MPTYEYLCRSCGERIERVQAFTDDPLTVCPSCGGELRKVFGSVGIVFKGSGFYKTDSRATTTATTAPSVSDHDSSTKPAASSNDSSASGSKSESSTPAPATTPASPPSTPTAPSSSGSSTSST